VKHFAGLIVLLQRSFSGENIFTVESRRPMGVQAQRFGRVYTQMPVIENAAASRPSRTNVIVFTFYTVSQEKFTLLIFVITWSNVD